MHLTWVQDPLARTFWLFLNLDFCIIVIRLSLFWPLNFGISCQRTSDWKTLCLLLNFVVGPTFNWCASFIYFYWHLISLNAASAFTLLFFSFLYLLFILPPVFWPSTTSVYFVQLKPFNYQNVQLFLKYLAFSTRFCPIYIHWKIFKPSANSP